MDPVHWSLVENLVDYYASLYLQSYSLASCMVHMNQPPSMDGTSGLQVGIPGSDAGAQEKLAELGFIHLDSDSSRCVVKVHPPIERIPLLPVPAKYQKRAMARKKSSGRSLARRTSPKGSKGSKKNRSSGQGGAANDSAPDSLWGNISSWLKRE